MAEWRERWFAAAVFRHEDEPRVLGEYLSGRIGVFVEVGAYHPIYASQTYALEQRGWTGVLIEPVPAHAERLRANRRAQVVEVACGSPEFDGRLIPMGVTKSGLSTLDADRIAREPIFQEVREVPVLTLDHVLEEANVERVDFVSIDVEGMEVEVLRGFDLAHWRPGLLLLEDHAEGFAKHHYMRRHGYRRVRRTGDNSWYVPNSIEFPISWLGRWQLLRKYNLSWPFRMIRHVLRRVASLRGAPPVESKS